MISCHLIFSVNGDHGKMSFQISVISKFQHVFTANTGTPERTEIHGVGYGSPKAYGAAVYVHTVDMNGHINIKLVMSKS